MNYELIAVVLKGLQMGSSLGSFLTVKQHDSDQTCRKRFHKLLEWGATPQPLEDDEIESFLGPVYRGLITERRGKPAHSEAYIAWAMNQIREMLHNFNGLLTSEK